MNTDLGFSYCCDVCDELPLARADAGASLVCLSSNMPKYFGMTVLRCTPAQVAFQVHGLTPPQPASAQGRRLQQLGLAAPPPPACMASTRYPARLVPIFVLHMLSLTELPCAADSLGKQGCTTAIPDASGTTADQYCGCYSGLTNTCTRSSWPL